MTHTRGNYWPLLGTALLCLTLGAAPLRSAAQAQMNADALADFRKTDAALTIVYNHVTQSLPAPVRKKLAASEKAWLAFRDADAHFSAGMKVEGGDLYPTAFNDARTALTRQRIARLKKIAPPPVRAKTPLSKTSPALPGAGGMKKGAG